MSEKPQVDRFTDSHGQVAAARQVLRLTAEELAEQAQINSQFVRNVEARAPVPVGPTLDNLFAAIKRLALEQRSQVESLIATLGSRAVTTHRGGDGKSNEPKGA